jgi:WD40 repeat protein
MSEILNRPTTTTDKDFSYWDDIPPIVHYPVHLTSDQVNTLYEKIDFRYGKCMVDVFGLVSKYILAGDGGEIYIHDTGTGALERRIETGHDGSVKRIDCWRGDIVHIVTASSDGTCRVFNFETGKYLRRMIGHEGPVNCLRVSEDEDFRKALVVTGGKDFTVRVYYLCSGRNKYILEGHKAPISAVDFMPVMGGFNAIVSADVNGEILIWDKDTGDLLRTFQTAKKFKPPKAEKKKQRFT